MEIPQIKDKITARAFALALSVKLRGDLYRGNDKYSIHRDTVDIAKDFEKYIIGDAELPEIQEDPTKSWVNTLSSLYTKQFEENKEKMDKDWMEFKKTLPIIDNSIKLEQDETSKEWL